MKIQKKANFRRIFAVIYVAVAFSFITIGLQPAEAAKYDISAFLNIPSAGVISSVTKLELQNHELKTPNRIVGSYTRQGSNRTLLIGHSTSVFSGLKYVNLGDMVFYGQHFYRVEDIVTIPKEKIDMNKLLKASEYEPDTIILMTCAGELYGEGDATHRLIITARLQD